MDDFVVNVRQIGNYTQTAAVGVNDLLLIQQGGLGGAYASIRPQDLVANALAQSGSLNLAPAVGSIAWGGDTIQHTGSTFNFSLPITTPSLTVSGPTATIAGAQVATQAYVNQQIISSQPPTPVTSFNGRTGAVLLTIQDLLVAGGAPIQDPFFLGAPKANTPWDSRQSDDTLATTAFVWSVINDLLCNQLLVFSFNGRGGNVVLTTQDVNDAYYTTGGGVPKVPNPAPGDASNRIASTQWVDDTVKLAVEELFQAIGDPTENAKEWVTENFVPIINGDMQGVPTAPTAPPGSTNSQIATTAFVMNAIAASTTGVATWNGRTGAVTMILADITAAGGAPISNPVFTGNPQAPTPLTGDSDTSIATTAFVHSVVAALPANVLSFNGRSGTVSLTTADVTGAGGAPIADPHLTGVPTAPTPPAATNNTQIATTAYVTSAIATIGAGVVTWNGRTGAVNLQANDISAVGGAMLNNPNFTGIPTAPTPPLGISSNQIATTAFVVGMFGGASSIVSTFNGRAGDVTLTYADVIGVGAAPINNPAFTGVPTAPTPSQTVNDTTIATTAYVKAAVAAASGVASFNGRVGVVTFMASDVTGVGGAMLASPAFIGSPTAPTAAPGTATTVLATTAFVTNAITNTVTSFNSRIGSVILLASDISGAGGALLNSPVFSGTPTAPTPSPGTNNNQIATTSFVMTAVSNSMVQVADTAPIGPLDNSLWFESDSGILYVRYNDGDSSQWVSVISANDLTGAAVRYDMAQSLTTTQQQQACTNINALNKAGGTMTGALSVVGLTSTDQIKLPYFNGGMELGSTTQANTPFIDFHSSGNDIDYDARIIASGGSASTGAGTLGFNAAAGASFSGGITAPSLNSSAWVNVGNNVLYFGGTGSGRYITWDGSNYSFLGGGIYNQSGNTYTAGGTFSGYPNGNGAGTYYFGNGSRYLTNDGTNFSFSGGNVYANANVFCTSLYAGGGPALGWQVMAYVAGDVNAGIFYLGNGNGGFATINNAANTWRASGTTSTWLVSGDTQSSSHGSRTGQFYNTGGGAVISVDTSSRMYASYGHFCRNGYTSPGGYGGNVFNPFWNGSYTYNFIDNSNMGAFTMTSDYRTKKHVRPLQGMWETIKKLNPIKYTQANFSPPSHTALIAQLKKDREADAAREAEEKAKERDNKGPRRPEGDAIPVMERAPMPNEYLFIADDDERWGFMAHELQETLVHSAAHGEKDAPNQIQSPNPMTLLAAIVKALQEAMARIEKLEAA